VALTRKAVLRGLASGHHERHAGVGAGLQRLDRPAPAAKCAVRHGPVHFSWVPQPSSAGCMPSERQKTIHRPGVEEDVIGLRPFERWVFRVGDRMPLTPTKACGRGWPQIRGFSVPRRRIEYRGATSSNACLTNPEHHAGMAAARWEGPRFGAAGILWLAAS